MSSLTIAVGDLITVTTKLGQSFTGTLRELDKENLVIETSPGWERVFRVERCSVKAMAPLSPPRRRIT